MPAPDWDARYRAAQGGLFGEAPNDYLRMLMARSGVRPASALMLADGDGRNGSWLAGEGVAVTAVDISAEATRRALARDAAAGVAAERLTADLMSWRPADGRRWDMACIFYLQGPPDLRARAISLAARALRPGGWFALEGFAVAQGGRYALGPDDPSLRYDADEVAALLPDFTILEALTGRALLDEGPRHAGEARVARVLARRDQPSDL